MGTAAGALDASPSAYPAAWDKDLAKPAGDLEAGPTRAGSLSRSRPAGTLHFRLSLNHARGGEDDRAVEEEAKSALASSWEVQARPGRRREPLAASPSRRHISSTVRRITVALGRFTELQDCPRDPGGVKLNSPDVVERPGAPPIGFEPGWCAQARLGHSQPKPPTIEWFLVSTSRIAHSNRSARPGGFSPGSGGRSRGRRRRRRPSPTRSEPGADQAGSSPARAPSRPAWRTARTGAQPARAGCNRPAST